MSTGWYYSKDRRTRVGPVSPAELRELARTGQIDQADLVQREGTDAWQPAGKVKGLFDRPARVETPEIAADGADDLPVARRAATDGLRSHPAVLVLSLACCFPAGLALIWTNRSWSNTRKATWTGVWAAVVGLMMIASLAQQAASKKSLDEADRLWEAGQRAEAVGKYKAEIDANATLMDESRRPTVFQRVIDHEAEAGNLSTAKQYLQKAEGLRVAVASEVEAVKALLVEAKADREEAERKRKTERKKEADQAASNQGESNKKDKDWRD